MTAKREKLHLFFSDEEELPVLSHLITPAPEWPNRIPPAYFGCAWSTRTNMAKKRSS